MRDSDFQGRCLRPGCTEPATHWQGGGPYCERDAWLNHEEEGGYQGAPVPGNGREFTHYYTDREWL